MKRINGMTGMETRFGRNVNKVEMGFFSSFIGILFLNALVIGMVIWGLVWGIGMIADIGLKNIVNGIWEGNTNQVEVVTNEVVTNE